MLSTPRLEQLRAHTGALPSAEYEKWGRGKIAQDHAQSPQAPRPEARRKLSEGGLRAGISRHDGDGAIFVRYHHRN